MRLCAALPRRIVLRRQRRQRQHRQHRRHWLDVNDDRRENVDINDDDGWRDDDDDDELDDDDDDDDRWVLGTPLVGGATAESAGTAHVEPRRRRGRCAPHAAVRAARSLRDKWTGEPHALRGPDGRRGRAQLHALRPGERSSPELPLPQRRLQPRRHHAHHAGLDLVRLHVLLLRLLPAPVWHLRQCLAGPACSGGVFQRCGCSPGEGARRTPTANRRARAPGAGTAAGGARRPAPLASSPSLG